MKKKRNGQTRKYISSYRKQERVFETPFQWTIIRNVSSKKRQTIFSESPEFVATCYAV